MTILSEIKNFKSFENNPFIISAETSERLGVKARTELTSTQSVTKLIKDKTTGKENNENKEMRGD